MLGINFNVSAGQCKNGVSIQLLSFDKEIIKMRSCTGGLSAPELQFISKEHDNTLATFVIGLADIAIINMGGETQTHLSDILETVVLALIQMDKIELHRTLAASLFTKIYQ